MEVKIISKETIKPSSPTPPHLNNYKLSLLDQVALIFFIPIILFFEGPTTSSSDVLKKSLSELLTHLYALAGRLKDIYTIDCNDEGVEFVDAHVSNSMSDFLRQPNDQHNHLIRQLLPLNQLVVDPNDLIINSKPLLGVQASYFGCGGMAIGVCVSHCVVDVSTMAMFLTNWAKLTLGSEDMVHVLPRAEKYLFPSQDIGDYLNFYFQLFKAKSSNMATRRFRFHGSRISELRETVAQRSVCVENPTRYEAVSALLWGAAMSICEETEAAEISPYLLSSAVDLRRRTSPPLAPNTSGSLSCAVPVERSVADYNCLAGKIRESIRKVDQQYIEVLGSTSITSAHENVLKTSIDKVKFMFSSSWCRYPFYECDFGWGKPFWLATDPIHSGMAALLDTKDGDGIEAWLALDHQDMLKFEQNSDILKFSSKI